MRITLGVTDATWAAYLRERPHLTEVNFWVPSGRSFMGRASADEPFLFKTKSPENRIVGGGFYVRFWELRVSEAWATFGEGNGVGTEQELETAIQRYRARTQAPAHPDPTIGCLVLRNPFFAPPGLDLPQPQSWGASIVQGKTYDSADPDFGYVGHAFDALQGYARVDYAWDADLRGIDLDAERYGKPVLTRHRLGQGSFRLAVLDAYDQRCAITGSRTVPALEAAHIRAYADGGLHHETNGMALRSDLHRLYDRGYIGVDTDLRLRVSPSLGRDFGNGVELYERERRRQQIRPPQDDRLAPDPDALAWHMRERFRAA
ncbi:hypothetical protein GCM10028771_35330 [Nocardioides marmoraquaticus]